MSLNLMSSDENHSISPLRDSAQDLFSPPDAPSSNEFPPSESNSSDGKPFPGSLRQEEKDRSGSFDHLHRYN
jgi:hypothetical protein